MDEIITEFLVESHEGIDRIDADLIKLERNPEEHALLEGIFRDFHTIKGTAGMLGFSKLEHLAHVAENLLDAARNRTLTLTSPAISALLASVDTIRAMLNAIEATGSDAEVDDQAALSKLNAIEASTSREDVAATPQANAAPVASAEPHHEARAAAASGRSSNLADQTLRVSVDLLERLMNLVGELVLARNQILQFSKHQEDRDFLSTTQRLNLITSELQESVMKARMQPIKNVWGKFPRLVRDTAEVCGKKVRVEMEGRETELDKTLIEAINDPMIHLVRNSVDHGIETPEERRAAGKPEEGLLLLRAFHEDGQVNIEIVDDGGGIDPEYIRRKALEKGLATPEKVANMSRHEIINLIFAPGFSTVDHVTNVSGRGVGMDVVKTNIEKIGGTIDLRSNIGEGTTVHIKIPLTLAIIPALIVTCSGARYAIPQVSLLELVRLEEEHLQRDGIESVYDAPVYRLRGKLLPLVFLDQELRHRDRRQQTLHEDDHSLNIVVLQAANQQFGLVVDEIIDTEEIVVKPLGQQLNDIPLYAGATIMGDGRVALILDVHGIARSASVCIEDEAGAGFDDEHGEDLDAQESQRLLLFQTHGEGRMVMPLSAVARLEEFPNARVEQVGTGPVVQYRGEIMQLLPLADALSGRSSRLSKRGDDEMLQVVVYQREEGSSVGIVVDRILDVVEAPLDIQPAGKRNGVLGSIVLQDRITEVLDLQSVIKPRAY